MVTVHRAFGFRFVIFANDHAPPHVHMFGNGGEAKMELADDGTVSVTWSVGISRADLRRLMTEARARHRALFAAWKKLHG